MDGITPLDELAGFLSGNSAASASPQNPLNQGSEPSASPSNPNMNPSNPTAWTNPSNPELNSALPNAVTNPSNPKYNPSMPGATNNPSNYAYNPQMPGSMTNPASPQLNPAYPSSLTNPANPIHNPDLPVHQEYPRPPGLSENASLPPAHAAWHLAEHESLWWKPGEWGRGLVHDNDMVYTWPEEDGTHTQMSYALDTADDPKRQFVINPEGEFSMHQSVDDRGNHPLLNHVQQGTGLQPDPSYHPTAAGPGNPGQYYLKGYEPWAKVADNYTTVVADAYTNDTREWADPTEPRASEPPAPHGCTCRNGTDSFAKLHCPIHGLDGQWEEAHDWSLPEGQPVGYPTDQPRAWMDAYRGSSARILPIKPRPVKPSKFITTREDHERGKRQWFKLRPKKAALSPESLQRFMTENTNAPYLYHATTPDAADAILQEGLYPHDHMVYDDSTMTCQNCGYKAPTSEIEADWPQGGAPCPQCGDDYLRTDSASPYTGDYYEPRPGHTYMGNFAMVHKDYFVPRKHRLLRIDLRKLDPSLVNADEDAFNPYHYGQHPVVRDVTDQEPAPDPSSFGEHGLTFGQWADQANLGQDPAETHHSLFNHGSIAYNGVVPPEAIEEAHPHTGMALNQSPQATFASA